jgi:replicative DNA helicase
MSNQQQYDIGKLPPQNIEIEEAVLGSIILEPDAFLKVSDIITSTDFYKEQHSHIFDAIISMFADNQKIDILTLVEKLRKTDTLEKVGGAYFIATLTKNIASAAHIERHATILSELSIRRNLITEAQKMLNSAYDTSDDLDAVIDRTISIIDRVIFDKSKSSKVVTVIEAACIFMEKLNEKQKFDEKAIGTVKSDIRAIRKLIPEYSPGHLIIIAARPSMGKTDFAIISEAWNAAKSGNNVLVFSLEMTAFDLAGRIIQRESGVTNYDMERRLSPFEYEQLDKALTRIQEVGLFIDDTPAVSFGHIKAKTKIYKKRHDIKAVVIDYIQLMATDKSLQRERQVAVISGQLKELAKEFEVPVIALSQLNRNSESRSTDGFKPRLSDLRESGAIEQDADIVIFPHRPGYYYPDDIELDGIATIIVAKNRGGKTGEADIKVDLSKHIWADIDEVQATFDPVNLSVKSNTQINSFENETPF